jgi:NAD(P)-dependent dehydrogenase (short-subunit alcohol dehydrogenase family)
VADPDFEAAFKAELSRLIDDPLLRDRLSAASAAVCDGRGAARVATRFLDLIAARGDRSGLDNAVHPPHLGCNQGSERMSPKKSVVVTGASTGIGWAVAQVLTQRGFHVFGSVRKAADAERLTQAFGDGVTPLVFDVTDEAAVRAAAGQVEAALDGRPLAGLVNNAGIAVAGPLLHLPIDEWRKQLEVNLTGVVIATQAFAPLLGARGTTAAKDPGRHRQHRLGRRPQRQPVHGPLLHQQVRAGGDVGIPAPRAAAVRRRRDRGRPRRGGHADLGQGRRADTAAYAGTVYAPALDRLRAYMLSIGKSGLPPERIGEAVHTALTVARPKVRYTITPQPLQMLMADLLPKRTLDRIVGKRLGLLPG